MNSEIRKSQTFQHCDIRDFEFPSWSDLIEKLLNEGKTRNSPGYIPFNVVAKRLHKLDQVKASISNFHPSQIIQMLSDPSKNVLPESAFNSLLDKFRNICIADNQFYTVYDINVGWHTIIDPKIETALGLKPSEFSLQAMAGLDPDNPLFHPDDVYHMIRHASIGYLILSFPAFQWRTMRDYYVVRYRVGTKRSSISSLRAKQYVTLEKRCYPIFGTDETGQLKPIYHFDQWSVLDASDFDYVKPMWVTSTEQSELLNGLFYLFQAYLLDISPKHLAFLNERVYYDRNKSIANSVNEKIEFHTAIRGNFDEIQVSNAFTKTVRPKVSHTTNVWCMRTPENEIKINSEQGSVHHCRSLGVLPIPSNISTLLYRNVRPTY